MTPPAQLDPLLLALIELIPSTGEVFTTGDRERWVAAMDASLQFLYPPEWAPEARKRAKEAAAAHFPTIIAPPGGVTIPGPVSEPVLVVPGPKITAKTATYVDRSPRRPRCGICRQPVKRDADWLPGETVDTLRIEIAGQVEYAHIACMEKLAGPQFPERTTEEAPSTTSADAVDDATSPAPGGETTTGADDAAATSSRHSATASATVDSPPESEPSTPSSGAPVPEPTLAERLQAKGIVSDVETPGRIAPPREGAKRHFTADQKGAILRRIVWEGMEAVADDTMIHKSTLNRWVREMPIAVQTFTDERDADLRAKALAEGGPTVAEVEAEKKIPVPPRPAPPVKNEIKTEVAWPTGPIGRRPIDHERTRREQADWA